MRVPILLFLTTVMLAGVYGCGAGGAPSSPTQVNSAVNANVPAITGLSPSGIRAGEATFPLTVFGSNFVPGSIVRWNGTDRPTNSYSGSATMAPVPRLTAQISASDIGTIGTAVITVFNPAPGGGTSNAVNFTVGSNPMPTISFLLPSCTFAGAKAFALTVFGSNFVPSSVVQWNGNDRPTTLDNNVVISDGPKMLLTAQIPASDLAVIGTAEVKVFSPSPGGGNSTSSTFIVGAGRAQSIAVDPTGKFAYVANEPCTDFVGDVSMYTIDPTTGTLTSIGPPVPTDLGPRSVKVEPSGKFAYVANWGEGDTAGGVSMYTIDPATGALTSIGTVAAPCGPPPSPGACAPFSIAMHPSGHFVYVANEGGFAPTSLSMYRIDGTTGMLSLIGVIATGGRAIAVTVDPSGKFAYAVDGSNGAPAGNNNVSMYSIDTSSGALTFIGTIATGSSPGSIAVHPSGKFAYVTNSGSNDISMYSINTTTGDLTSIGTIIGGPGSIAIHPSGKFAYVGNSLYTIDGATGALTFEGTTAAAGPIAINPSGKFAYVLNPGLNSVSIYSIDSGTGMLTLIGTVPT